MKKTIIHVNQHVIKRNRKQNLIEPPLTAKSYNTNDYGTRVDVLDENGKVAGTFVYSPHKPLSCGAHVWFETYNEVIVHK